LTGWVKTHRKIVAWEWYKEPYMFHLFSHLILSANHEPGKWKGIDILPGQVVTGRYSLSKETGISEQSLRTCLNRLKSTGEITIKSTNQFSLITIMNWPLYQGTSTNDSTNEPTSDQPATNQRPTTNKNVKKERKFFVQPTLDEVKAYCRERNNTVNPDKWYAHYQSNGWKVGKALAPMKDWQAAIRTWEENQKDKPIEPDNSPESQKPRVVDMVRLKSGECITRKEFDEKGISIGEAERFYTRPF